MDGSDSGSKTRSMGAMFKMSRNIDDISSIFRVSVHPNTISANDSRLREKSDKIEQNRTISLIYRRYIGKMAIYW